jgi:hypothetical protein
MDGESGTKMKKTGRYRMMVGMAQRVTSTERETRMKGG